MRHILGLPGQGKGHGFESGGMTQPVPGLFGLRRIQALGEKPVQDIVCLSQMRLCTRLDLCRHIEKNFSGQVLYCLGTAARHQPGHQSGRHQRKQQKAYDQNAAQ
ncbi:MAG: hypothetical protein V4711_01525 [Pseudomonadota bacterium]